VSKLHRALADAGAPARLVTAPSGYCLDEPADAVDALRFERTVRAARAAVEEPQRVVRLAREALALWRGEPLAGATLEGEAASARVKLTELRDAVLDDRVDAELRLGRHAALVAELEALVAATPLRERRWCQLIVALYRCGRQSDALGAYRQARHTLADQSGQRREPSREVRAGSTGRR
jgi:DNA-binding SARP family transcriptional activator